MVRTLLVLVLGSCPTNYRARARGRGRGRWEQSL